MKLLAKILIGGIILVSAIAALTPAASAASLNVVAQGGGTIVKLYSDGTAKVYSLKNITYSQVTQVYTKFDPMNPSVNIKRSITLSDLSALKAVVMLPAGDGFVVLKKSGDVYRWKRCLADLNTGSYVYVIDSGAMATGVASMTAGANHLVFLTTEGKVLAYDKNGGKVDLPASFTDVRQVSSGWNFIVALKNDGTVVAWGTTTLEFLAVPPGLKNVKIITAGLYHVVAMKNDGYVVKWGDNRWKQMTDIPDRLNQDHVLSIVAAATHNTVVTYKSGNVSIYGTDSRFFSPESSYYDHAVTVEPAMYDGVAAMVVVWPGDAARIISNFSTIPSFPPGILGVKVMGY